MKHTVGVCLVLSIFVVKIALAADKIEFDSYNTSSIADILNGGWQKNRVNISGNLSLPDGDGPFPAVIAYHGSGHVKNMSAWMRELANVLNEKNIAMFALDSYTNRRVSDTGSDQSQLSKATRIVDAFMALKKLQSHPKILQDKIGITGYSFGGIVAMHVLNSNLKNKVLGDGVGFAASMPVYPSCQTVWINPSRTGAPMLILAGKKDNYTWAKYCEEYTEKMQGLGYDVKIKVYPKAHHKWIDVNKRGKETRCNSCWHFNKCGHGYISDDGEESMLDGKYSTKMGWNKYVKALSKACGKKGVTMKYQKKAHDDTLLMNAQFFSSTLQ